MAGTRLGLKTITFACDEITLFFPADTEPPEIEVLFRLPLDPLTEMLPLL